jgi:pentose-5-phosphate-3-epimerase
MCLHVIEIHRCRELLKSISKIELMSVNPEANIQQRLFNIMRKGERGFIRIKLNMQQAENYCCQIQIISQSMPFPIDVEQLP